MAQHLVKTDFEMSFESINHKDVKVMVKTVGGPYNGLTKSVKNLDWFEF